MKKVKNVVINHEEKKINLIWYVPTNIWLMSNTSNLIMNFSATNMNDFSKSSLYSKKECYMILCVYSYKQIITFMSYYV